MFFTPTLFAVNVCNIFFDGTTNDKTQGTNVWNMFNALIGSETIYEPSEGLNKDDVEAYLKSTPTSRSIYVSGVATSRKGVSTIQSATGAGIERRAIIAYHYLTSICETDFVGLYELKIVGFSRGAVTARMFSTYLSLYGISLANMVPIAKFDGLTNFEASFLDGKTKSIKGRIPSITFLGIYDTVAAIGKTRRLDPDDHRLFDLPGEESLCKLSIKIPNIVVNVAHAVAINEYRYAFEPTYIERGNPRWIEKYFLGSHADIGGYANSERQKIALSWMIQQGFSSVLGSLSSTADYILSLRASTYRNSYTEVTIAEGPFTRKVDWTECSADTLEVGKDGGLTDISYIQDTMWLEYSLYYAEQAIAALKKGN